MPSLLRFLTVIGVIFGVCYGVIYALATYVKEFVYDTGITRVDSAGDVGSSTTNAIPKWRANLIFNYQRNFLGIDARVRYVGSGKYDHLLDPVA